MSNWREQLSEGSETEAAVAWLMEYYHIPTLIFLIGFTFWNRIRNWSNFVVDGIVYFSGNDPWYHYRSTEYASENLLGTMPYDPWTYFPFGTAVGQFGTLFDQIIALVALILGLGSPSESLLQHVFLLAPPFFAVAICLPAYFIGRRLGGRVGGLVTVAFIALAPDRLLQMTLAGHVQHESAEALFMSLSIIAIMIALSVAEREKPVYELLATGDLDTLRGTIGWSLLAGVAMALYLWVWPPGLWLFGILGVFFVVHLSWEHIRGRSPEHAAFVGVVSLLTAGLLQLVTLRTLALSATNRSIAQPGLAFAIAFGVLFLAWLSREIESRDLSPYAYPGAVAGSLVIAIGLMVFLLPDLFDFFYSQVDRVLGFVTSPGTTAGTIGEAQPPADRGDYLYSRYGLGAVTAVIGAIVVFVRQLVADEPKGEQLFVVVWGAFMLAAAFTQVRFGYYLTVPIGALNAVLAGFLIRMIGMPTDREFTIETYQILTVALVVLVMFVPLAGISVAGVSMGVDNTATDKADRLSQPGNILGWGDSLDWMEANTPVPGQYANPDGEPMEYFGTYERTDDFAYPDGAYGVLSWWDYGHWITTKGERIPTANPFQEGASNAANFLLAQDEDEAQSILESQLDDHDDAQTRYVMVDWLMAETEAQVGGKYFAPIEFHNEYERSDFYQRIISPDAQVRSQAGLVQQTQLIAHSQRYYDSMLVRLYHYHGSSQDPEPIGVDRAGQEGPPVQSFDNIEQAREWASEFNSRQIGGVGLNPEERVEALEQFRLVHMSDVSAIPTQDEVGLIERGVNFNRRTVVERTLRNSGIVDAYIDGNGSDQAQQRAILEAQRSLAGTNPAWTKTFERVEGATINGEGPANSTIELAVDIEPENGQPFVYEQQVETDTSGDFTATVPYSTTGYDEVDVDDGYTNVSARANSSYRISTPGIIEEDGQFVQYSTTADVSEQQVIGKDNSPVEVELERQVVFDEGDLPDNGPEETGANETDGGTETDGETADETEPDGQTETSDQNDSTESLDDRSGSGTAEIERIRIRQQ